MVRVKMTCNGTKYNASCQGYLPKPPAGTVTLEQIEMSKLCLGHEASQEVLPTGNGTSQSLSLKENV